MAKTFSAYDITFDPAQRLVRVAARGVWGAETVRLLSNDLTKTVDRACLQAASGKCVLLIVKGSQAVHTQLVAASLQELVAPVAARMSKVAIVTEGMLLRLQVQRIGCERLTSGTEYKHFSDEAEALSWLKSLDEMADTSPSSAFHSV